MSDDDKESTLKRERPEEEAEQAEEERPAKITKKDWEGDEAEGGGEEKAAADEPPEKDCSGDDCGTETGASDGAPTEDGDAPENEESKEEKSGGKEEETETKEDESGVATETENKPTSGAVALEEAKATDASEEPPKRVPSEETPKTVDTSLESTEAPSGLPDAAQDPSVIATVTNPDSVLEERAELDVALVGRVIGKGGEQIRDLNARSGCRVDVDQQVPEGAPRIITYRGTRQSIDFAKQLVATLCSDEGRDTELPLGLATMKELIVPSSAIGKVIGRAGEMVRDLQNRSKSKIQIDHSNTRVTDPNQRLVVITGTQDAVVKAEEMIMFLVANPQMDARTAIDMLVEDKNRGGVWGSGPPYPNLPNQGQNMTGYAYQAPAMGAYQPMYGGGYAAAEMEIFYASKTYMGRIIGKSGVTINDLQKRSGCDIQINQNVPHGQDCEISIKGTRQGIESVKMMLREIIESGPNHPYAGGSGAVSYDQQGGYQQAPPMSYPYQQPQAQPYGGYAYGAQGYQPAPTYGQPQMPPYQAQQPYGMPAYQAPPPQQYGQPPMQQAPPPPPAEVWRTATTADGQTYYYNEKTGQTQWEKPMGM